MASLWIVIVASISILSGCIAEPSEEKYAPECKVWDRVVNSIHADETVSMSCRKNVECTGFACSGKYDYSGIYSLGNNLSIDYCFAMAINPCHNPIDVNFYIDIPTQRAYQKTINGTTDVEIPGLRYDLGELGYASVYVSVNMSRRVIHNDNYVLVGMRLKVRIEGPISSMGEWPSVLQRQLVPNTFVPVPPCDSSVVTPTIAANTCKKYAPPPTLSPPSTSSPTWRTTTTPKDVAGGSTSGSPATTGNTKVVTKALGGSSTHTPSSSASIGFSTSTIPSTRTPSPRGRKCSLNKMYDCDHNEVCIEQHCQCLSTHMRNTETSQCVPIVAPKPTSPPVLPDPYDGAIIPGSSNSKNGVNPLYYALPLAGIVLICIAAVGILMFVRYRRHQQRYGQHELLVNNEEEDDDDPIDVST